MTTIAAPSARMTGNARGVLLSTVIGAVVASIANAVVAIAGRAAGADPAIQGLTPPAYITFTVIGVLAGAIGWALIRRTRSAARTLTILVPVILVLSLIPDVALAMSAGSSGIVTAAITLGVMHVVTVAIAVPIYRKFLPISHTTETARP
jgi:hypothetical protein